MPRAWTSVGLALGAVVASAGGVEAVEGRFVLHRQSDVLCFHAPCPNWTGRNLATGEVFAFDEAVGIAMGGRSNPADAWARGRGVIVTGSFEPRPNDLHIVWAPAFIVTAVVGPARAP